MKNGNWIEKFDSLILGILMGVLLPILTAFVIYFAQYRNINIQLYLTYPRLFAPLLQLGAISNLACFFLMNIWDLKRTQQGIIAGTLVIGAFILLAMFLKL